MKIRSSTTTHAFTLVEIMIVVAIIALLASMAVPSFLRARKRAQATSTLGTLRIIDGAKEQYALENNKAGTVTPTCADLLPYVKKGSRLYTDLAANRALDALGAAITMGTVDVSPRVNNTTKVALADALGSSPDEFWGSYK